MVHQEAVQGWDKSGRRSQPGCETGRRRRGVCARTWAQASLRHRVTCGHTWCTRGMSQLASSLALSADFSASSASNTALSSETHVALSPSDSAAAPQLGPAAPAAVPVLVPVPVPVPVPAPVPGPVPGSVRTLMGAPFMIRRRRCTSAFTARRCSALLRCAASHVPQGHCSILQGRNKAQKKAHFPECRVRGLWGLRSGFEVEHILSLGLGAEGGV